MRDGLPANQVTDIARTPDGYLWLSTFDGLVRFDGNRFVVYNMGNSEGLPSNRIPTLDVSRSGDIWLQTETRQLVRFHEGRFRTFGPDDGLRGAVLTCYEDPDGTIWIGSDRDVARVMGDRVRTLASEPLGFPVSAIVRDRAGALWIGSQGFVQRRHRGTVRSFTSADGLPGGTVVDLFEASDGTLWVLCTEGMARISGGHVSGTGLPGVWGGSNEYLIREPGGRLAGVATNGGMFVLHGDDFVRMPWPARSGWLPSAFLVDPDGTLWGATPGVLWRGDERVLEDVGRIQALLRDAEGSLWVGGTTGLRRLKPTMFENYGPPEGFGADLYGIHQDASGTIWLASLTHGLTRYDGKHVTRFTGADGLPTSLVLSVYRNRQDTLWVGF